MATVHVRDVMHTPVINITPQTTLPVIEQCLIRERVRHLPVLEGGEVVGMVTYGDVRHAQPSPVPILRAYEQPALLTHIQAAHIMSQPVISVAATTPLSEAARLMLLHHITSLPVLRRRQMVGIITASDILAALLPPEQRPVNIQRGTRAA